jgi:hypothetical protein
VAEVLGVIEASPSKIPKRWDELQRSIEATTTASGIDVSLAQI